MFNLYALNKAGQMKHFNFNQHFLASKYDLAFPHNVVKLWCKYWRQKYMHRCAERQHCNFEGIDCSFLSGAQGHSCVLISRLSRLKKHLTDHNSIQCLRKNLNWISNVISSPDFMYLFSVKYVSLFYRRQSNWAKISYEGSWVKQ